MVRSNRNSRYTRLQAAMMTSLGKAARGRRRPVNFRKRKVSSVGREMYEVRWQKSLRNNLHYSDQKSVQLER